MDAHIDCYRQICISLTPADVEQLIADRVLFDRMHHGKHHMQDCLLHEYVTLRIDYVPNDPHPDDLPWDRELLKDGGFQLFIGRHGISALQQLKEAGTGPLYEGNYIRSSYISLDK